MAGPEHWILCCDWLKHVGLIGSDHLLATNQAKLTDLCRFLRDGVMLCKLLYLLDKNSIDLRSINQRPHKAQFLCLKNIGIFLQTCEQKFDLHKDDLFEPHMLFESSDFKKVLQTLSKLSNCPKAQRVHNLGFPEERSLDGDDNEIYETLERDMANGPAGDPTHLGIRTQESPDDYLLRDNRIYAELKLCSRRQEELENIYEDVEDHIYDLFEIPEELFLFSDAAAPRVEAPDLTRKRDLCHQEIVETENNYVTALNMLCTKFLEPLKKILFEEQIKKIFGCIPELARIHQVLHRDLRDAQNSTSGKTISEVFLENQERLIIYGEYCANLAAAQQEVEDVMNNNEDARNLIQECQSEVSDGRHQLRGYLVVPVQRILKYHLLLQELVRHTQAQSHSDLGDLKRAHEAMKDLAEYINEVKRDKEMLQIIRDLRNSIMEMPSDINDWQDLGKLRHDGETKIECHPEPMRKRYVFVFDKVMVICSKQTRRLSDLFLSHNGNRWSWGEVSLEDEKYFFKDSVKLENCRVENSVGSGMGSNTKGRQNSFYLVVDVNKKAYTIITKDSDSKEKWMKSISDAIEYLNPSKNQEMGHSFTITTFSRPNTRCMMCNKLLKGTIFQITITSNLRQTPQPPSIPLPPLPLPAPRLPLTPQKEVNQDQEGIVCRVQGSITKLRERCQSALKSLIYWDVGKEQEETEKLCAFEETENLLNLMEEENLPILGNKQHTMERVQLRPRFQGIYSKEWAKRLTDYQFLSSKDEEIPKRSTQYSTRAKRNNWRATVMVPQATRRRSDPGYKCSKCELVMHRSCLNGVQRCEGRARHESPIPAHQPQVIRRASDPYPGYGNLQLQQYAWWVEEMTRKTATEHLRHQPEGTFLIRWSDRHKKLVLSLKVACEVKHMKIMKHEETGSFYLSEVRYFRSLDGLINYYRHESLSECFSDLFAHLTRPLYEVAIANFAYHGQGRNHLSLELGDRVIVISHDGENNGWWKGRIENRVGYFPKNFVTVQNPNFRNM